MIPSNYIEKILNSYTEYIYSLRCPITYDVFYVGKTENMALRLRQHISDSLINKTNNLKANKINAITKKGLSPIMREIDKTEIKTTLDWEKSFLKEVYWINAYLSMGWNLTNTNIYNNKNKYGGEKDSNKKVRVILNIPDDVLEKIQVLADNSHRSRKNYIENYLNNVANGIICIK